MGSDAVYYEEVNATKLLIVVLVCLIAAPAAAQSYPSKPIEMISPTNAGGGSDLVARMVADIIAKEKLLSQPVIIQNPETMGSGLAM